MSSAQLTLHELQSQMLDWLQQADPLIKSSVTGTEKVSAEVRLDIYANAYKYRLVEALQDTFPALHTLMGDEDFFALGIAYIDNYPSQHFSLRYFGHQLSHFLATEHNYSEQPILAEMALFEWLLRAAFDAADQPLLDLPTLQAIALESWPQLRFEFHPTVQRINLLFNSPQLWQAIDKGLPPIDIEQFEYPLSWCIWRRDLRTLYRSMPVDEAWALDAMLDNYDFTYICNGICEWIDEQHAPVRVAGFINSWVNEGLVSKIKSN